MTLIRPEERDVVRAIGALLECNPFLPARVALERRALGDAFVPLTAVWHAEGEDAGVNPNTARLLELAERLGKTLHGRLVKGARASAADLADYRRFVLYLLWLRYEDAWWALIPAREKRAKRRMRHKAPAPPAQPTRVDWYPQFARDVHELLSLLPGPPPDPAHLFALGYQARRAFHYIFRKIFGGSLPAALLRAAIWQAIFTVDIRVYREHLYERMYDFPTLITGEVGTGKELAASAIALSQYLPFDPESQTFAADPEAVFCALNPSALSPTLIESELFGHRRGAFTGAVAERRGFLEACGDYGAVFLDEIGELEAGIQVKLLRVLQSRDFYRVGETTLRYFGGKLITATHRDLEQEIEAGRFGADLYDRICANVVRTPPLRVQLADAPEDLHNLVRIAAVQVAGPEAGEIAARQAEDWIARHLARDYAWPGNMRQLEQCVRSVLVDNTWTPRRAKAYSVSAPAGEGRDTAAAPASAPDAAAISPGASSAAPGTDGADPFMAGVRDGTLTAEALLQGYCARVYAQTRNYEEAAQRLEINWKTVRKKGRIWTQRGPTAGNAKFEARNPKKTRMAEKQKRSK